MVNEEMRALGAAPNKIRETFAFGLARKAQVGADKVFDLSIGNPSVPAPREVAETITRLLSAGDSSAVHGYTPSPGLEGVRAAIAANLNERFGCAYTAADLYLTSGASSAIAIALKALALPGEKVVTIAPYFTEYKTWAENAGAALVEVPARADDFQMDLGALDAAIDEKTAVVVVNTPNNPVGVVYPKEDLAALAKILRRKSAEFGRPVYLLSDEPYRELFYEAADKPCWVPALYENTLVAYSWSKSLSLPGERIAYLLVPPAVEDARRVYDAVVGAGRAMGYICAGALFQHVVAECAGVMPDTAPYARNRLLFMEGLERIGYDYVRPQGAFYLWIRALGGDAQEFYERAKAHDLLLVPGDEFGCAGWVRAGYCCDEATVRGALGAFQELWDEYRG